MGVKGSRSGLVNDILLAVAIILGAIYLGIFRNGGLVAIMKSQGTDWYYLAWITAGGFIINSVLMLIASFLDGNITRRSFLAICSATVGSALYLALAVGTSIHVSDLDKNRYHLEDSERRNYKFLLAADYLLAFIYAADAGIRIFLRVRSGDGKEPTENFN